LLFEKNLIPKSSPLIAITGATGTIGSALAREAIERGFRVRSIVRSASKALRRQSGEVFPIGMLSCSTDWSRALANADCIVHCVGLKNQVFSFRNKFYSQLHAVNFDVTVNLAEQAAAMGVRRIIFISSAAVDFPQEFVKSSLTRRNYTTSKLLAENYLRELSQRTSLEVVIIRPAAVYGVGANSYIDHLIKLVRLRVPLPLASFEHRRSILNIRNLTDFLILCLSHPHVAGNIFSLADSENLSLKEIITCIGKAIDCDVRMFPVPKSVFRTLPIPFRSLFDERRLTESALVDMSSVRSLQWKPPLSSHQGISELVASSN